MNGLVSIVDLDFHSCMIEFNDDYNIVSYIVSYLNNKGGLIISKVKETMNVKDIKKTQKIDSSLFINMLKEIEFELSAPQIC